MRRIRRYSDSWALNVSITASLTHKHLLIFGTSDKPDIIRFVPNAFIYSHNLSIIPIAQCLLHSKGQFYSANWYTTISYRSISQSYCSLPSQLWVLQQQFSAGFQLKGFGLHSRFVLLLTQPEPVFSTFSFTKFAYLLCHTVSPPPINLIFRL